MIGQWTPCDKTDGRVKSFLGKSVFLIEQQGIQWLWTRHHRQIDIYAYMPTLFPGKEDRPATLLPIHHRHGGGRRCRHLHGHIDDATHRFLTQWFADLRLASFYYYFAFNILVLFLIPLHHSKNYLEYVQLFSISYIYYHVDISMDFYKRR